MLVFNNNYIDKCFSNIKIATLGPEGTSSEYIAKKFLQKFDIKKEIILFHSYESAYKAVKLQKCDGVIVANAYKNIDIFYMDEKLPLLASWIDTTPLWNCNNEKF